MSNVVKLKQGNNDLAENIKRNIAEEERRNEILKNQNWDQVKDLYNKLVSALVTIGSSIDQALADSEILNFIADKEEFNLLVNGLNKDLNYFSNEIKKVYSLHIDKTGPIKDEDELMETFSIYGAYDEINNKFSSVVTPVHSIIMVHLQEAFNLKNKQTEETKND